MAISIPSDLVLDVVRAADPVAQQTATMRLGTSNAPSAPTTDVASLGNIAFEAEETEFKDTYSSIAKPAFLSDASGALSRYNMMPERSDLGVKFEAMLLHQFIGEMLPKDSEALYGAGTAGEIWRSMMAEQLGEQLAQSHAVGLADYLNIPNANKTVKQG